MTKDANFYKTAFQNSTFIIKISGKILSNLEYLENVIENIKFLQDCNIKVIIVCGFGKQLDELSKKLFNKDSQKINGRRVTNYEDIEAAKMCCGKIICDINGLFSKHNITFTSIFPITKKIIDVQKRQIDTSQNFGLVGDVMSVHSNEILNILEENMLLCIASLAVNCKTSEILNINADTITSSLAASLKAEKVIFISDVDFVKDKNNQKISVIKYNEISNLINSGVIKDGMLVKLENIKKIIENGTQKVHIINGMVKNAIKEEMFSQNGIGTVIECDKSYNY